MTSNIPYGYCHCGCGEKTKIAPQNRTNRGWVRGEPLKYIGGHNLGISREMPQDKVYCTVCTKHLVPTEFRVRKKGDKEYYLSSCIDCTNKKKREYTNKIEEEGFTKTRKYELKSKYNLTIKQYVEMIKSCENSCEICQTSFTQTDIHVDHCHTSGEVRGLLCFDCNTGLGRYKDSEGLLLKAIEYLRRSSDSNKL